MDASVRLRPLWEHAPELGISLAQLTIRKSEQKVSGCEALKFSVDSPYYANKSVGSKHDKP
jgi:hypothetical protein